MDRPRILFVLHYHLSRLAGGSEEQSWLLATELARRGWEVHYASEMNRVPDPGSMDGVTLHGLPENPPRWEGNRGALQRVIAEVQPDVIYNRMFNLYTGRAFELAPAETICVWAAAAENDGMIWRKLWGMRRMYSPHRFAVLLPWLVHACRAAKKGLARADLVLVQRTDQVERLRQAGLNPVVLRNSRPAVPDSEVQSHGGRPIVLWAGSLKRIKRPERFVELADRCRDLDAEFVVIGQVQQPEYRQIIENAVRQCPNLRYDGLIPLARVQDYFRMAHLLVNTSTNEGYSNTFIHAWQHGIPVVTLGVNPDRLITEKNLGVAARNMDELVKGVRELVSDPEKRREIGKRARAFAEEEHNLTRAMDRIERLLAERGVRRPER